MIARRGQFYALQHVTGPGHVLVSLKFGQRETSVPEVVRLPPISSADDALQFDLDRHLQEIESGVAAANRELGGSLRVAAVEVVPDDRPQRGQAEAAAYRIARAVLQNEV
jgi:hypothetical protein